MTNRQLEILKDNTEDSFPEYLIDLWAEFSDIQHASFLLFDKWSVERFSDWLKSGNPEDAWS